MSTGSTQSFFSICKMRPSAEIGSEKMTRSTRVWRANSTRSSTVPSLGTPSKVAPLRSSPRSSNTPMMRRSVSRCAASAETSELAAAAGADQDGAAVETALPRPAPHQKEQSAAERDQREQPDDVEGAKPDPREFISGLREKRRGDGEQEHHGPCRGEPHILLLVAAEGLDLIDIGGLEGQHRDQRDADDAADVIARQVGHRDDQPEVQAKPDRRHQRDLDGAHEPRQHDRRISALETLRGHFERRRRKHARRRRLRGDARQRFDGTGNGRRRFEYRALFGSRHG